MRREVIAKIESSSKTVHHTHTLTVIEVLLASTENIATKYITRKCLLITRSLKGLSLSNKLEESAKTSQDEHLHNATD